MLLGQLFLYFKLQHSLTTINNSNRLREVPPWQLYIACININPKPVVHVTPYGLNLANEVDSAAKG